MTKYLILGSDGQLGSELRSRLDKRQIDGGDVTYALADVDECNITDGAAVASYFSSHSDADVVFNAAAYTAVDDAESNPDAAMAVNGIGAGNVAAACRQIDARLIHYSTDFVFGDGDGTPFVEEDETNPLSVYGSTKRAGERLALQNHSATAVLRTCGLYSRWGPNFVRSIAGHAREKETLQVVNDQYVGPTPVGPLAEVSLALADGPLFSGGIYHASVHGECTWYEFAAEIVELLGLETAVEPTTSKEWGAPARRSRYSVLDNRKLRLHGADRFDAWDAELARFVDDHGEKI